MEASGPANLFGVFEDDGETGYLYLYEPEGRGIVDALKVHAASAQLNLKEAEIEVRWSDDHTKCGVIILGRLRAYFDLAEGRRVGSKFNCRTDKGINDPDVLREFGLL